MGRLEISSSTVWNHGIRKPLHSTSPLSTHSSHGTSIMKARSVSITDGKALS